MDTQLIQDIDMVGGAGLMFLAYYILHQSTFAVIKNLLDRSAESFASSLTQQSHSFADALRQMAEWSDKLSNRQALIDDRNYRSMCEQLEALQALVATITRVETKVDALKGGCHREL